MENALIEKGFFCKERKKFNDDCLKYKNQEKLKNPPRFVYVSGTFRVLTESRDCPFWTVQKMSGTTVLWFVDFPFGVGHEAVFVFLNAASAV
jgi:hypothetical protein